MHPSYKHMYEQFEQLESDLATAEQDSRQKQARVERLQAAVKELREALCAINLCQFNSMSSREEMVRLASAALKNTEDAA